MSPEKPDLYAAFYILSILCRGYTEKLLEIAGKMGVAVKPHLFRYGAQKNILIQNQLSGMV